MSGSGFKFSDGAMLKTRQFVNKVEAFRELILMVTFSITIAKVIELVNLNVLALIFGNFARGDRVSISPLLANNRLQSRDESDSTIF